MSLENLKVDYQADDVTVLRENHSPAETSLLNEVGHKNMLHLIHLRWIAVAGQVVTIAFAAKWFGVRLPVFEMFVVVFLLFIFNTACHMRWNEEKVASNQALFWSLLCDVFSLSALLYFSGGTSNPFVFLFLLQIILAAILLNPRTAWLMMVIASLCVLVLSVYYQPLLVTEGVHFLFDDLYFKGLLSCFVLVAALLVFFITRISNNLRAGEAYLALLRQRAAEEDHIVRMGLLASGAAHELGTPLSTMSVILNDWKRMQCFQQDISLRDELDEVQSQVLRCKSIVSGILLSAGEARGESSRRTTLRHFVDDLVEEWKNCRIVHLFDYCYQIENDFDVVSDSMLKQTICNLLDNALEASPDWLSFRVYLSQGVLNMVVLDQGLGFPESILSNFARPYNSTKGSGGRGLGLFLAVNVARKLGGTVKPYNQAQGGGGVHLSIPLSAIILPAGE